MTDIGLQDLLEFAFVLTLLIAIYNMQRFLYKVSSKSK